MKSSFIHEVNLIRTIVMEQQRGFDKFCHFHIQISLNTRFKMVPLATVSPSTRESS